MYPVYRCMDSFPHQRNQMPYTQHYYPSFEGAPFPPQVKVDPSRSPVTYETWPYGGSYGGSLPMGCRGCCNHNYFPGYGGFRPLYPHFPPPSPSQCHGGYPSFPETYPVHYVPSPHYSMEQPRFEHDKNVPGNHHCCGCPNHSCNKNEDRHVKIEEQEPDVENKNNNSVVPVEFKNYPYPIVWIPPGYMKNREQRDSAELESKYPSNTRAHENLKPWEQEPNVRSGWFPFDINNLGSLKHGGDREKTQDQPNEDKNQFQFPIFWLPYKPEEEETRGLKDANVGRESADKSSSNLKADSAQLPSSDDRMNQPKAGKEKFGSEVGFKPMEKNNANQKAIAVKQQEEQQEKGMTEETERKAEGIAVKEIKHSGEKKLSEDGTKRQSSSPPKTSKLPPVCLRVETLSKRKKGNGSSKSPSPGHKDKAQEVGGDESKSTSPIKESMEVEPNKGKRKVIKVVDGITKQDAGEDCKAQTQTRAHENLFPDPPEEVALSQATSKVGIGNDVRNVKGDKEARDMEGKKSGEAIKSQDATVKRDSVDSESQTQEEGGASKEKENLKEEDKVKRKNMSEAEAALIIQSAYRGFEVRRWEPLKKLKQIAELREQVAKIRSRIDSPESSSDVRFDDRQKLVIGETIMSLLLKLDTIQGLHPTIRNFRKSVAKELVSLQEKLDSLSTMKSEVPTAELLEDLSMNTGGDASFEGPKEVEVGHGNSFAESNHGNISESVEPCQGQVSNITKATSGFQTVETSGMKLVEKDTCKESEDKILTSAMESSGDLGKAEAEAVNKLENDLHNEVVLDDGQMMMLKTQLDGSELKLPVERFLSAAEETVDAVEEVTVPSFLGDQSAALPGVFTQELVNEESLKNEHMETGNCEVLQGEDKSHSAVDITTQDGEVGEINQVPPPLDALMEEPVIADPEHETGRERDFEHHEDAEVEQEGLLVEQDAQGEEVGHINEHAEIPKAEDGISLKNETLDDARLEIDEFILQKESNINELLDTSELEKPQPQLLLVENEIQDGEAYKLEEHRSEFSLPENETHSGEASQPEETRPELSPAQDETRGGQQNDDSGITNDEDNCFGQEKEVPTEETKECNVDSKITIGEENQEKVEGRCESEHLQSVVGNDNVIEQLGSEPSKEEAMISTQFAPGGAERPKVEAEFFPMSPTSSQISLGSDMGSENDDKLLEENKKLREMMEKLIEAGKEQLTAISNLSGRVNDLEKKLARKKKSRTRRFRAGSSCVKLANDSLKGTKHGIAV